MLAGRQRGGQADSGRSCGAHDKDLFKCMHIKHESFLTFPKYQKQQFSRKFEEGIKNELIEKSVGELM